MDSFSDDLSLLSEFLSAPNTSAKTISIWQDLNSAYKKNSKSTLTQHILNEYIQSIGDNIADACVEYMKGSQFASLSNSAKATVIRDIMGEGLKVGFGKSTEISQAVYSRLLQDNGYSFRATRALLDEKRFNEIIKIAIGDSLDEDYDKAASFISGSFRQVVQSGNRETIAATGYELSKHGISIFGARRTTSSDPCQYCRERNGVLVSVDEDGDGVLFSFHDHCRCELEIVVR